MDDGHIIKKKNFWGPGLGIKLDDKPLENERGVPEWEFPEMWDSFDGFGFGSLGFELFEFIVSRSVRGLLHKQSCLL